MVELLRPTDLTHAGLNNRGTNHAPDPFVTPGGNRQQGIIVLAQNHIHGFPFFGRQRSLHGASDLHVAFQEFERNPFRRVGGGNTTGDMMQDLIQRKRDDRRGSQAGAASSDARPSRVS